MQDKEAEIPLGKGEEVVVSRASHTNRIRDIGLLLVALGLGIMIFMWMNSESKQQHALKILAQESKEAVDKVNQNMDALQAELDRVKKGAMAAEAVKADLSKEFNKTREMLIKVWAHQTKELDAMKRTLERIEKQKPKEGTP